MLFRDISEGKENFWHDHWFSEGSIVERMGLDRDILYTSVADCWVNDKWILSQNILAHEGNIREIKDCYLRTNCKDTQEIKLTKKEKNLYESI